MSTNRLSIVYNSDLVIRDKSYLSTLAIFYDHIFLPAEIARQTAIITLAKGFPGGQLIVKEDYWREAPSKSAFDKEIRTWEIKYEVLFQEDVITRLDSPDESVITQGKENLVRLITHINQVLQHPNPNHDPYYQALSRWIGTDLIELPEPCLIYMDMYFHQRRQDIILPGIFAVPVQSTRREVYESALARNTFSYLMPKIRELEPHQILEIREVVADYREGFSMHLQELSSGIEDRLKNGDTFEELSHYAQSMIETQLIPDYREFNSILEAREKRRHGKILDIAGKLFEIDAVVGSPKFFAQFFRKIGEILITEAEEKEINLTNRHQAYQFMREVETSSNV